MTDIEFSILMGRVSTEDGARVLECLDALRRQESSPSYEVIITDRLQGDISETIRVRYPEAHLIPCGPDKTLPEMRRIALGLSSGRFVIVTEDHCVPSEDWLASFQRAIRTAPADAVAFGGCVENGVHDTALDWATFLCEYSNSLSPRPDGYATDIPGMNVAYHRSALTDLPVEQLDRGFWETTVHPDLEKSGKRLFSSNDIKIFHCKKFSLGLFCRQRFVYSKYFAGIRYPRASWTKRYGSAVLSFALPPVLFWRMMRSILAKKRLRREFVIASPYLALFAVIWAVGDIAGYVFGPGRALLEIE